MNTMRAAAERETAPRSVQYDWLDEAMADVEPHSPGSPPGVGEGRRNLPRMSPKKGSDPGPARSVSKYPPLEKRTDPGPTRFVKRIITSSSIDGSSVRWQAASPNLAGAPRADSVDEYPENAAAAVRIAARAAAASGAAPRASTSQGQAAVAAARARALGTLGTLATVSMDPVQGAAERLGAVAQLPVVTVTAPPISSSGVDAGRDAEIDGLDIDVRV